jgi:hypothetical protein
VYVLDKSLNIGIGPFIEFEEFFVDLFFLNSFDEVFGVGRFVGIFAFIGGFDGIHRRVGKVL